MVPEVYYDLYVSTLHAIDPNWKGSNNQKDIMKKAQERMKELFVRISDGGKCEKGVSIATFYGYMCKVKKTVHREVLLKDASLNDIFAEIARRVQK